MKRVPLVIFTLLLTLFPAFALTQVSAVPQLMHFQGRLARPDGTPVPNGSYSLRFSLWTALSGGTEKWNQTVNSVQVRNGTFAALLSGFPAGTFDGNNWLEIKIGTNMPLTPRQQLVSVAYAMKANSVPDGSITGASIANATITANKFAPNIFNPLAWLLGGNSGVTAGFLGTTDANPLELRANNRRVLRLLDARFLYDAGNNFFYESPNFLGGHSANSITDGVAGVTLIGGGLLNTNGNVTQPNRATDIFTTLIGGAENQTGNDNEDLNDAPYAAVLGGKTNFATASFSSIGGGQDNTASDSFAHISGGASNTASNRYAVVGGGNTNSARGNGAVVGGGLFNYADGTASTTAGGISSAALGEGTTVSGGGSNIADGLYSTVGGGYSNYASANYATVAGGNSNTAAGEYSFAAGRRAKANHAGTFVWADSLDVDFVSTATNQFILRAVNGVGINKSSPTFGALDVAGNGLFSGRVGIGTVSPASPLHILTGLQQVVQVNSSHTAGTWLNLFNSSAGGKNWNLISTGSANGEGPGHFLLRNGTNNWVAMTVLGTTGHVGIGLINPVYRLELPNFSNTSGRGRANSWTTYSSGRWKHNLTPIENALDKVVRLRGVMFDWLPEHGGSHDIGFVAEEVGHVVPELVDWEQDGKYAFGLKYDRITALTVEAIKQQQQQITALQMQREADRKQRQVREKRLSALEAENAELKAKQSALETRLDAVETALAELRARQK